MTTLKEKMNDQKRIEFTKQLEFFYEISHPSWRRVLTFAFLKGMATGFGVLIGGTLVVALVLWLLSLIGHVPFLSEITESTKDTLQN